MEKKVESPTMINILKARKNNGLFSAIVVGERGIGKSSYSIQTLYQVFRILGYDQETSWNMALDRMLFKIKDVINFLEESSQKKDKDIFIWDDAGVFAGGVRWLTHYKEMALIESVCDTLRSCLYGLLLTVPDIRTLSRRLRSYDDYVVKIYYDKKQDENDSSNSRTARIYKKAMSPAGQSRIYKRYYDRFDIMLPDWVYRKYQLKRKKYGQEDLQHLKKMMNKDKS